MNNKHILQIIIKNTSTLDFTIPLFWKLRQKYPNTRISILYFVFNKKEILREAKFYDEFFAEYNIGQYDLSFYFYDFFKCLKPIFEKLFTFSKADKLSFYEIKENLKKLEFKIIPELFKLINAKSEKLILKRMVNFEKIFRELNPDIILYDNRAVSDFVGREYFYNFMYQKKLPTFLIPHGPHMRDPLSEFCAFDEKGEELPSFCKFLVPFKYGTPWKGREDKREQFFISGYPGFDSDWLNFCKRKVNRKRESINILFIIRRFLQKGVKRDINTDYYIIDFEEFFEPLQILKNAIDSTDKKIKIIVKPHPSNNFEELKKVLNSVRIDNWEITHEPIYPLLNKVDLVVSLPSTVLLIPAMAGIPTIIFNTKLQKKINQRWNKLKELYTGMQFYLEDNAQFQELFHKLINNLVGCYQEYYLRAFFNDNSSELLIKHLIGETNEA